MLLSGQSIETTGDARLLAAERTVRTCDAAWTILRPAWFYRVSPAGVVRQVAGREPADFETYAAAARGA